MKNIYIIILIFLGLKSFSQNSFGVFGGLNFNSHNTGIYEDFSGDFSVGVHLGVLYEYELNNKFSLRPKIVFSQQGDGKETGLKNSFFSTNLDYKTTYLNMPIDIKYGNKTYLIFGAQIGFLLNTEKQTLDYGDLNYNIDFGINLGGGYELNNIFFEIGIYQGLSTIFEFERSDGVEQTIKNSLFRFSVGYKL